MRADVRSHVLGLIFDILERLPKEKIVDFCEYNSAHYNSIIYISNLLITLQRVGVTSNTERKDLLKDNLTKLKTRLCEDVIEKNIDLYSMENFSLKNSIVMIRDLPKEVKIKYLTSIFNSNSIYRMLYDALTYSVGDKHNYWVTETSLENLNLSIEKIDLAISKNPPNIECEKRLYDIYMKYKEKGSYDDSEKMQLSLNEPIDFSPLYIE